MKMEMEMEKAKDTQRASERNRQFGSLQMSGNWKEDGEGEGEVEEERERGRVSEAGVEN